MPNFKPKSNKKIKYNKKSAITLDTKHKEFLNEFSKDENNRIPELKLERINLKAKLEENIATLTVEQKLDIEDQINEITHKIKTIKSKKKEYFLDNSKFIFDYFENKKNISSGQPGLITSSDNSKKAQILNSFFKIKKEDNEDIKNQNKSNNIVQKYLSNIDDTFLDINSFVYPTDICGICKSGELIPLEDEGMLVCNICSRTVTYLIENEKPSYKEPPK